MAIIEYVFFFLSFLAALKNKDAILQLLETCAQYVPKAAAVRRESPECLDKGLKLRKIHIKGQRPTLDDFYEVCVI